MLELSGWLSQPQTSILIIVFALAMTLVLSLLIVLTYDKTSRQVSRPDHFIQSLLLMSLVTCTIMQSIGDSLALSFGIFGALAIIRFRTRISDPRDVAFVFASMAVGIACGVHSFYNGVIGTLAFCLVVVIIRFSPFGQKSNLLGSLRFECEAENEGSQPVASVLENCCSAFSLKRKRFAVSPEGKDFFEFEYRFKLKNGQTAIAMIAELRQLNGLKIGRLVFDDENDIDTL